MFDNDARLAVADLISQVGTYLSYAGRMWVPTPPAVRTCRDPLRFGAINSFVFVLPFLPKYFVLTIC